MVPNMSARAIIVQLCCSIAFAAVAWVVFAPANAYAGPIAAIGALLVSQVAILLYPALEKHWALEKSIAHDPHIGLDIDWQKLLLAVEQGANAVMFLQANWRIDYANSNFAELLGNRNQILNGRILNSAGDVAIPESLRLALQDVINSGREWQGEVDFVKHDGSAGQRKKELAFAATLTPVRDEDHMVSHVLLQCEDISERKSFADRLFIQTNYDSLTGLPNRRLARKMLDKALADARHWHSKLSLVIIDLDRFKYINDSLGLAQGDTMLVETANRLRLCVREDDFVSHIGADTFLIGLSSEKSNQRPERIAEKALSEISRPYYLNGNEISITACAGLSQYPADSDNTELLMRNAEAALHAAKKLGAGNFSWYAEHMRRRNTHRLETEAQLRRAIENNELTLYFQPVVSLADEKLVASEVLLRWSNPELGNPNPESFITIAEDTGLIIPIGDWVLETACRQAADWQAQGLPPMRIAINISSRQFVEGHVVHTLKRVLEKTRLDACWVELEITEGLLLGDVPQVRDTLKQLKELGVRLSLDDFGTGYSSLSYLKRYPFDTLKIDRSFVRDMSDANDSRELALAIVAMAHSLGLEVVAEGVEKEEQKQLLAEKGCDMAQGFLYNSAMPAQRFAHWAREFNSRQDA